MIYTFHQAYADLMAPLRALSGNLADMIGEPTMDRPYGVWLRAYAAAASVFAHGGLTHERPDFGIASTPAGGAEISVSEEKVLVLPFGTLLRFKKDSAEEQPKVLVVAPLSGHFATLLRGTITTLLPENDVFVTDWHNARDVPLSEGRFGFDEFVNYIVRFLQTIGPKAHMVAVCQPCAHALAAVSVMAQDNHPDQPASMTLMAGPVDTRINPTKVNELAKSHPIDWFEHNLISTVPYQFAGGGRQVYPGFMQLMAFMSMNAARHIKAQFEMMGDLARGETAKAKATQDFYEEYFAVLDLTAEFYLETVNKVFQQHQLPIGTLTYDGVRVEPRAIRRTGLLTVEGERDDICSVGQTLAAQDLCSSIKPFRKRHHLQAGVGHYGVFSGSKWHHQIYPLVRNLILAND